MNYRTRCLLETKKRLSDEYEQYANTISELKIKISSINEDINTKKAYLEKLKQKTEEKQIKLKEAETEKLEILKSEQEKLNLVEQNFQQAFVEIQHLLKA